MRRLGLEYGSDTWTFDAPDESVVVEGVRADQVRPPLEDPVSALQEALAQRSG